MLIIREMLFFNYHYSNITQLSLSLSVSLPSQPIMLTANSPNVIFQQAFEDGCFISLCIHRLIPNTCTLSFKTVYVHLNYVVVADVANAVIAIAADAILLFCWLLFKTIRGGNK